MLPSKSAGTKGQYQKMKPITDKNVGKKAPHEKKGKKDYSKDKLKSQLRLG